jgi:hypothetical protein
VPPAAALPASSLAAGPSSRLPGGSFAIFSDEAAAPVTTSWATLPAERATEKENTITPTPWNNVTVRLAFVDCGHLLPLLADAATSRSPAWLHARANRVSPGSTSASCPAGDPGRSVLRNILRRGACQVRFENVAGLGRLLTSPRPATAKKQPPAPAKKTGRGI